jgi:hypothetical protein
MPSWSEKPIPIQLDFTLFRMAELAAADSSLRERQPYKAAVERDYHWLGAAMVKHYHGDDADLGLLMAAVQTAFGGMTVDDFSEEVRTWLQAASHPVRSSRTNAANSRIKLPVMKFQCRLGADARDQPPSGRRPGGHPREPKPCSSSSCSSSSSSPRRSCSAATTTSRQTALTRRAQGHRCRTSSPGREAARPHSTAPQGKRKDHDRDQGSARRSSPAHLITEWPA